MLRPKQMSRVSVTGTKRVLPAVIETMHNLNLVHIVGYDGSWDGFSQGDPMPHGDVVSEQLVTVRSIENILGLDEDDIDTSRDIADEAIESRLEAIRTEVNALDDRRAELRDQHRDLDDRISVVEPFVDLGIDLDLLHGYDSLAIRVGEANRAAVEDAAATLEAPFEVFAGDRTVAIFAATSVEALDDALVGVEFSRFEIPDGTGDPEQYITDLEAEKAEIEAQLEGVESEIQDLKFEAGGFLLAAEERLTIEAQKTEAPLSFATTENAFIAEGWIPSERYGELEAALDETAGDHVDMEVLERASYNRHGQPAHHEAATDGGTDITMGHEEPPVVLDNPGPTRPFELLVNTISRPSYSELDPTLLVFLTFPTFFGFMIGDVGYGILYMLIGYWMVSRLESPALKSLGGVALWAGFFTIVFGFLYGEFFGLHALGDIVWGGHPPMEKGLDATEFALVWLVVAMVLGVLHVSVGYALDFINTLHHSVVDAVLESASWFLLMGGVWVWVFSRHMAEPKPAFLFTLFNHGEEAVYELGFAGFSPTVGRVSLGVAAIGLLLMIIGEVKHEGGLGAAIGILESPNILVNVLSYARIPAVLLAKAGMAFVVNLLVFGLAHGHFAITGHPEEGIGLIHGGVIAAAFGLVILVLGHLIVLALGITSAGLQAIRLEYVEFFQKFYEGGGEVYEPFGYGSGRSP